ncbi:hypothetical protein [Chryseobacterium sp. JUb7]|uniref:hypothetical protein n=1 Tax=Chryseobacterium sp. JUb7 TaxID=2940599 RepID=UPI002169C207|nr:hypothetical protein [Chryseobacterium sp. JUb7]MCS3529525.1 hypothetical protein [Chryseobacterium sp. JUb7]
MKTYIKTILLILFAISNSLYHAQEVFFDNLDQKLISVIPSHYYPMRSGDLLNEFINKSPSDKLKMISAYEASAPDRFENNGEALAMNGDNGYVETPFGQFHEMISNKVVNMSFWARYSEEVYNGTKNGILFSIRETEHGGIQMIAKIENKQIVIYANRPHKDGGNRLVPVIKVDYPINYGSGDGSNPGVETAGYLFFCITSEDTANGKRTKIYFSRPGGRLYCRSFYAYPFEKISPNGNALVLWGGWPGSNDVKASGVDDLMFFQKGNYAAKVLSPQEVLNNYYLQSPLYEGVSYAISGKRDVGQNNYSNYYWTLQSKQDTGVPINEEFIVLDYLSKSYPFSTDRFMVIKRSSSSFQNYKFINAKMGGVMHPSSSSYAYMRTGSVDDTYDPLQYKRDVSDPSVMFNVFSNENKSGQFRLFNDYSQKYLATYMSGGIPYLAFYNEADHVFELFTVTAAFKIDRGSGRKHAGLVNLRNHAFKPEGEYISAKSSALPEFMGVGWSDYYGRIMTQTSQAAFTGFRVYSYEFNEPGDSGALSFYNNCGNAYEGNALMKKDITYGCGFHWMYVKDDVNGKPLYIMHQNTSFRNNNIFNGLFIGARANGQPDIEQNYQNNALNADGSIPDKLLWSIHKVE